MTRKRCWTRQKTIPMDISSNSEIQSGQDIESDTTPMAGEVFSVDSHVWETKVFAVQQRIKELSKMDSLFIKNTQVLNAKGKSKTFSALANSDAEVNIINRVTAKRMRLLLLNTNIGLNAIHGEVVKIYEMHYIEFQQKDNQEHIHYFQNIFLAADISTRMILDMS